MGIKKKLQNPFALVVQGFVAGAILIWATAPGDADASQDAWPLEQAAAKTQANV